MKSDEDWNEDDWSYNEPPIEKLPDVLHNFVEQTAWAIDCDPAFVFLPTLSTLAAAIGASRAVHIAHRWEPRPIIWTGVCGRSGSGKTPAAMEAVAPLDELEARDTYAEGNMPPARERLILRDGTFEGMARVHAENPGGLLWHSDELSAWLGVVNGRNSKTGQSDSGRWCTLHSGKPYSK